ncbi:SRPBCC family protein [Nocardiopsis sp. MG754419]|uniref:SRPBCC family protein n=1 Tax=Nocardiopsis sp. MG754419 TaxID=2259865 RepID=UPI001BA6065A|nr:SRPBCC family protein [Nocardiopsis sp. MG754419]MBR8743838.1 polyketide cyclase / dehydrase and lipid transport family protein [Nocardiopsis sp. MG754419]
MPERDRRIRPRRTTTLRVTEDFDAPVERVFALILSQEGFLDAMPPGVEVLSWPAPFEAGGVMDLRWGVAGRYPVRWTAVIDAYEEGRSFSDLQVRGPFRYWRHTHVVEARGEGTRHTDVVEISTGLGPVGDLAAATAIRGAFGPRLRRMHAALA